MATKKIPSDDTPTAPVEVAHPADLDFSAAALGTADAYGAKRLRLIVVDDNVDAAESMGMILSAFHEVRTAHDGEQALEIGDEFHPDAIVLDIGMPRMDGYELAQHIRRAPWGRKIVLIACTGWGQPDDRRRSQEAGIDHHMVKPVSAREMLQLLSIVNLPESG